MAKHRRGPRIPLLLRKSNRKNTNGADATTTPNNIDIDDGPSDVTIIVKEQGGDFGATHSFALHRKKLFEGPRRCKTLGLVLKNATDARLEWDLPAQEARCLPALFDYVYHGGGEEDEQKDDDTTNENCHSNNTAASTTERSSSHRSILYELAQRYGVDMPNPAIASRSTRRQTPGNTKDGATPGQYNTSFPQKNHAETGTTKRPLQTFQSSSFMTGEGSDTNIAGNEEYAEKRNDTQTSVLRPPYKELALLMKSIRTHHNGHNINNNQERHNDDTAASELTTSWESLRRLLTLRHQQPNQTTNVQPPFSVTEMVHAGGIPYLVEMISDDLFVSFQCDVVRVIAEIANASEFHAKSLLTASPLVEVLVACQMKQGNNIRVEALRAMGAIAQHSATLQQKMLHKGCFESIVAASKSDDQRMHMASAQTLRQFCQHPTTTTTTMTARLATSTCSSTRHHHHHRNDCNHITIITQEFVDLCDRLLQKWNNDITKNVIWCMVNYLGPALSATTSEPTQQEQHDVSTSTTTSLKLNGMILWLSDVVAHNKGMFGDDNVQEEIQMLAIDTLTQLIQHEVFVKEAMTDFRLDDVWQLFWDPKKQVQERTCKLSAAIVQSLNIHNIRGYEHWCQEKLLPPLSKLLRYGGSARFPAAKAIKEIVGYSNVAAETFVENDGIPALCDLLDYLPPTSSSWHHHYHSNKNVTNQNDNESNNDFENFKLEILLMLQSLLDVNGAVPLVGLNLAQVMIPPE